MRGTALLVILAVGLGSSRAAWAQCTKDTDCKGERICSDGVCTDAAPTATPAPAAAPPVYAPAPVAAAPAPTVVMSAPDAPIRMKRRSIGMYVTGIVLTSTGGLTLLGAGIVGMLNALCVDHAKNSAPTARTAAELDTCDGLNLAFWSTLIPGVALTGVGIPLWAIGGEEVRVSVVPQFGTERAGTALRLDF